LGLELSIPRGWTDNEGAATLSCSGGGGGEEEEEEACMKPA